MSATDAALHDATERIYQRGAQLAPLIQSSFADVEQWDPDTLIRRYCILRADLRDTMVRVCGVMLPPPDADLAWWRVNVADPADERVLKLRTDPTALPRLLIATQDNQAVHVLIGGLMGYYLVSVELLRRLEASKVSQTVRALYSDPSAEKAAHVQLLNLIGEGKEAKQAKTGQATYTKPIEWIESEEQPIPPSEGLVGFFEFLDKERSQGRCDADEYSILAAGPLSADRAPTVQQWERVAADLLVEDIRQREQGLHRALISPNLDKRADRAAKDAEYTQYRGSLAKKRGGPGTVQGIIGWKCDCGITHKRKVKKCETCEMRRPKSAPIVSLDSNTGDEEEDTNLNSIISDQEQNTSGGYNKLEKIEQDLFQKQRLANVQAQLPPKVFAAFQLMEDDENISLKEAAEMVGLDEKTLRRWRTKVRGQDTI